MESKKKMPCVSFTTMSRFYILPFLVPICCMITTYIQEAQIDSSSYKMIKYKLQSLLNIFISKTFAILFWIISLFISKEDTTKEEDDNKKVVRRYHLNVNSNNKWKMFGFIYLISLLNVIFKVEGLAVINYPKKIEIKLGFVILVPILSRFILGIKLYEHHFFALVLALMGFIFLFISLFVYNDSNKRAPFNIQIIHLIFSLPFSLSLVLIKYLFQHYFISPFAFLSLDGVCCIFNSLIYIILESIIYHKDYHYIYLNFYYFFKAEQSSNFYILTFFTMLFSFFYQVTNSLTLYYFTPTLLVMTDILSPFTRWILEMCFKQESFNGEILFKGIGYFIIICATFIFNEIVVINAWRLSKNTHGNIEMRSIDDTKFDENNETVFEDSFNIDKPIDENQSITMFNF